MPTEPSAPARTRLSRGGQLARLSAAAGKGLIAARRAERRGDDDAAGVSHDEIAQIVLETLGSMKGAAMKAGQLLSYLDLPMDEVTAQRYHAVLAQLQDSAAESDPDTIAQILHAEYGAPADQVFADWEPTPFAVASIGQVHRAHLPDGTRVAVKIQHPGVAEATLADLANLEFLVPLLRVLNPRLAPGPLLDEVRMRLDEELDYQTEARYHQAFAERYAGHPFVRVPRVHHEWCRPRVLVTDYVDGASFGDMARAADQPTRDRYGEIIFRFVFGSLYRFRIFNADPHPGNYLFPGDGTVAFIDFGSCKAFSTADRDRLHAVHSAVRNDDGEQLRRAMQAAGLLDERFDGDFAVVQRWFQLMHRPMSIDAPFTYTADYAREVTAASMDPEEGYVETLRQLQMPASYLMLNRIQFGLTSLLARMEPTACWGDVLYELSEGGAPATALGQAEQPFLLASPHRV